MASAVAGLLLGHGLYDAAAWFRGVLRRGTGGHGGPQWQELAIVERLAALRPSGALYCNYPDLLYLETGIHTRKSPRRSSPGSVPHLAAAAYAGPTTLVWVERPRSGWMEPDELREFVDLEVVATTDDGTIYRVMPLE